MTTKEKPAFEADISNLTIGDVFEIKSGELKPRDFGQLPLWKKMELLDRLIVGGVSHMTMDELRENMPDIIEAADLAIEEFQRERLNIRALAGFMILKKLKSLLQ